MLSSMRTLQRALQCSRVLVRNAKTVTSGPGVVKSIGLTKGARAISMTKANPQAEKDELDITFIRASGERIKARGKVGDTLLDVVVNNNVDLDGFGACEGTLTCSTCHLIFKAEDYAKLPDKPSDEEADMLDLAYDLSDTSRLGCQITLTKDMNGLEVRVPATVNDARSQP